MLVIFGDLASSRGLSSSTMDKLTNLVDKMIGMGIIVYTFACFCLTVSATSKFLFFLPIQREIGEENVRADSPAGLPPMDSTERDVSAQRN